MAVASFNPMLSPLVPAAPGRRGRAAFLRSRAAFLGPLANGAVVGRGRWRLAAAAEPQAVQEQPARTEASGETGAAGASEASSKLVLVVGGTGGVGQLVVASLLNRKIKSRLLLRDPEKAESLFGKQDESLLQVYKGDTRNSNDLDPQMFEGVTHVICCTGTTAFPSKRWDGDNTPERVDWDGIRNLVSALPWTIKRMVFVSSIGVTKYNEIPWSIMNLFGVLKYKKMAEDFVRNSGIPFTIIRPGRLTDGPYTSYDLNTLLKATGGERRAVVIGKGDKLVGEVSRLVVAEACIQALDIESTEGQIYEINSVKEMLYGNEVTVAGREIVEEESGDQILREATGADIAFLVVGHPFGSDEPSSKTTHTDLVVRAKKLGIEVKVIDSASVLNAVGACGLELHRYGEAITIPFFTETCKRDHFYQAIVNNRWLGLHTLCLLDIYAEEPILSESLRRGNKVYEPPRFMTVNTAISQLLEVLEMRGEPEPAYDEDSLCIGLARLGSDDEKIVAGPMRKLVDVDFGAPPHCLVIVGETTTVEEEMLEFYMIRS